MSLLNVGDRITHDLDGDGVVVRTGIGPKSNLVAVKYEDESERFIDMTSSHITAINGTPICRRKSKWKVPQYAVDATSQHFTPEELAYFETAVVRIVYRPHPWNFDKFKNDYESVTGQVCPLKNTNRHESAYADCAEIYLSVYPPMGMVSEPLKQNGDLWFFESVGTAWKLFSCGFTAYIQ